MMGLRSRHHGRRKGGHGGHGPLALVPMIDMLTILVVYLLVHAADYEILPQPKAISIPQSVSEQKPRESVVLIATRSAVLVNGGTVTSIGELQRTQGNVVPALRLALEAAGAPGRVGHPGGGREVTILADRGLPYSVVRKLMASASAAKYDKVSLAVTEKPSAGPA